METRGVRELQGVRRAQEGPGVPCRDAVGLGLAMVGPWQYQCSPAGYYTRYTHPPGTPLPHHPVYTLRRTLRLALPTHGPWDPRDMHI